MGRKKANIHYIYKTTCLVTGRYYIGMHSTSNLDDGYMGSGKRLRYSIIKHGKENHHKEIVEYFDSREELIEGEKIIITLDLIQDKNCMNLKEGGTGGFTNNEHQKKCSLAGASTKGRVEKAILAKKEKHKDPKHRELVAQRIKDGLKRIKFNHATLQGIKRDEVTKKKIGLTNSIKQSGKLNSQFGTCWITDGMENKKLKNDSLLPDGWHKGKTIKK